MSSCGDLLDVSVFRDNKIERMRTMKNYEGIMSIGNMELKDLVIEESPNSLIVTAKKKIYVPEKKIILMDQIVILQSTPIFCFLIPPEYTRMNIATTSLLTTTLPFRTICTTHKDLNVMLKNTVMRPSLITTSRFVHTWRVIKKALFERFASWVII